MADIVSQVLINYCTKFVSLIFSLFVKYTFGSIFNYKILIKNSDLTAIALITEFIKSVTV